MLQFKEKITKENYFAFKARHVAEAEVSKALRTAANSQKGLVRHALRDKKKAHKYDSRIYHLAMAFLKGRKLSEVEQHCTDDNPRPSAKQIRSVLCWHVTPKYYRLIDKDLDLWLQGLEEEPEELKNVG